MTATTKQKRSRKPAAKSATRSTPRSVAKPVGRPAVPSDLWITIKSGPGEPKYRPRIKLPVKVNTEASDRFHALPLKERDRILKESQDHVTKAMAGVMTLDDYLTERRREAERDA